MKVKATPVNIYELELLSEEGKSPVKIGRFTLDSEWEGCVKFTTITEPKETVIMIKEDESVFTKIFTGDESINGSILKLTPNLLNRSRI